MNPEDQIITQMGLLLTQVRFARRALEDIERSTAHYAGLAVDLTSSGAAIGAPPLIEGALAVYLTNIGELTSGGGGGFFEAIFGGIGRLLGGLVGGVVGGTIGALALPFDLVVVERIVRSVERIMPMVERIGLAFERIMRMLRELGFLTPSPAKPPPAGGEPTVSQLVRASDAMTRALDTAAQGPPAGAEAGGPAAQWLAMFRELRGVVDGLILLVPIAVGAIAALIYRLPDIKQAIVGILIFAVENLLVLRGVLLVTIFDTIAAAASLASQLLGIVGVAIDRILVAIINAVSAGLAAAEAAIRFLGAGLKATVDALMGWLRDGLGNFLIFLGNTRVFRLIYHIIDILPLVLPALLRVVGHSPEAAAEQAAAAVRAKGGTPADEAAEAARAIADYRADIARLGAAASRAFPAIVGPPGAGVGGPPGTGIPAPFPNIADVALSSPAVATFRTALQDAARTIHTQSGAAFHAAQHAMGQIEGTARDALEQAPFERRLAEDRSRVQADAQRLAQALQPAHDALAARPATGLLGKIAESYEQWLTTGGMTGLMQRITDHFERAPLPERPERSLLGRIVDSVTGERVRATVEIGELVVELGPPGEGPVSHSAHGHAEAVRTWSHWMRDLHDRGGSLGDPALVPG
jgi:hypothetical protein